MLEQFVRRELAVARAVEESVELVLAESMLGGARAPVLAQLAEVDVLLAIASLDGGDAEPRRSRYLVLVHALYDLRPPGRELRDHASRHVVELGHALRRRGPLDPERAGELGSELRLVEVAGGKPVGLEDRLAVERSPLAVARRRAMLATITCVCRCGSCAREVRCW